MTSVKLTTSRILDSGQPQEFGDVVQVDAQEAARLVKAGQAVLVPEPAKGQPHSRK